MIVGHCLNPDFQDFRICLMKLQNIIVRILIPGFKDFPDMLAGHTAIILLTIPKIL
jgi:hypothetical protein